MKKIVALLIALVMMISVCACTQNAEPANTDEPANTTPRPDDRTHRGAHHCGTHRRTRQSAFR